MPRRPAAVSAQPGNSAVAVGIHGAKYVRAFSGRRVVDYPTREATLADLVLLGAEDLPHNSSFVEVWRSPALALYRREAAGLSLALSGAAAPPRARESTE